MDNKNEIWKDIEGYEGMYQISNMGRVKSFLKWSKNVDENERILKPVNAKNGYLFVSLVNGGVKKCARIHRLVAKAFLDNPDGKEQVNHIDGCKTNNCVFNLEWVTPSENTQHAYRIGIKKYIENGIMKKKKPVQQIFDGAIIREYESLRAAQRETGIWYENINKCCDGKLKTAGGYSWKYKI